MPYLDYNTNIINYNLLRQWTQVKDHVIHHPFYHVSYKKKQNACKQLNLQAFRYNILYSKRDLTPHSRNGQGILSPSCLPIPPFEHPRSERAENETRTRDPNLGKVMLYQLSYFRVLFNGCKDKTFYNIHQILHPFFYLHSQDSFYFSQFFIRKVGMI